VVEDYFSIIEDLLIAYRIPVFSRRAKRRLTAHPKFYFFDAGVYRTLRPKGPLDRPEEAEGPALETLFFQELTAINDGLRLKYRIHYWRTTAGKEIDFILYGEKGFHAIEIKRTSRISRETLSSLLSFSADYPSANLFLFYSGKRKLREGRIQIIPAEDALRELPDILSA
jgi:predicted AAA+ superfamily ATPase